MPGVGDRVIPEGVGDRVIPEKQVKRGACMGSPFGCGEVVGAVVAWAVRQHGAAQHGRQRGGVALQQGGGDNSRQREQQKAGSSVGKQFRAPCRVRREASHGINATIEDCCGEIGAAGPHGGAELPCVGERVVLLHCRQIVLPIVPASVAQGKATCRPTQSYQLHLVQLAIGGGGQMATKQTARFVTPQSRRYSRAAPQQPPTRA